MFTISLIHFCGFRLHLSVCDACLADFSLQTSFHIDRIRNFCDHETFSHVLPLVPLSKIVCRRIGTECLVFGRGALAADALSEYLIDLS